MCVRYFKGVTTPVAGSTESGDRASQLEEPYHVISVIYP